MYPKDGRAQLSGTLPGLERIYIKNAIYTLGREMLIHTTWYGTFLYEEDNGEWKERAFRGAERESQKIADDLGKVARGDILDREREISSDAGISHVTDERLKREFPDAALVPHKDLMVTPPDELDYNMELLIEAQIRLASERGTDDDSNILSGV